MLNRAIVTFVEIEHELGLLYYCIVGLFAHAFKHSLENLRNFDQNNSFALGIEYFGHPSFILLLDQAV